jgi:hypothetical protein
MKSAISSLLLSALVLATTSCKRDSGKDATLQSPHFASVEIVIEKDGDESETYRPATSNWLVGSNAIDTTGTFRGEDYELKIIYLGQSQISGLPSDRYRIHAAGAPFGIPIGQSIGSDRHIRPFGESGMLVLSGRGINIYIKAEKKTEPNQRLQTMRFKLPMNSIAQGPHV